MYEESLTIYRQLGDQQGIAISLGNLGELAFGQGDFAGARALHAESLTIQRQLGNQEGIAGGLEGMAAVAHGQSRASRAARLGAAASGLRESIGNPRPPAEQGKLDAQVAAVHAALGETAFAAMWDAGRAMPWEQAVEYALSEGEPLG